MKKAHDTWDVFSAPSMVGSERCESPSFKNMITYLPFLLYSPLANNHSPLLSKHMNKHPKPYLCKEAGCEKLRGFRYSEGLLRHEIRVHRKHLVNLNCPYWDCKRSTGKGFSRQENLQEHLRRAHNSQSERKRTRSVASFSSAGSHR